MMNNCRQRINLQGFDIEDESANGYSCIAHFRKKDVKDEAGRLARKALKLFQDDSGNRYRFVSTVKAATNRQRKEYYITFTARQKGGAPNVCKLMQAVVRSYRGEEPYVMFCRIKPQRPPRPPQTKQIAT